MIEDKELHSYVKQYAQYLAQFYKDKMETDTSVDSNKAFQSRYYPYICEESYYTLLEAFFKTDFEYFIIPPLCSFLQDRGYPDIAEFPEWLNKTKGYFNPVKLARKSFSPAEAANEYFDMRKDGVEVERVSQDTEESNLNKLKSYISEMCEKKGIPKEFFTEVPQWGSSLAMNLLCKEQELQKAMVKIARDRVLPLVDSPKYDTFMSPPDVPADLEDIGTVDDYIKNSDGKLHGIDWKTQDKENGTVVHILKSREATSRRVTFDTWGDFDTMLYKDGSSDLKPTCTILETEYTHPGVYISECISSSDNNDIQDIFHQGSGVGMNWSGYREFNKEAWKHVSEDNPMSFTDVNIKEEFFKAGRRGKSFPYYKELFNKKPVKLIDQNGKEYTKGTDIVWDNPIRFPELSPLDIKKMTGANVGEEIKQVEPVECVNGGLTKDEWTKIYEYKPLGMVYRSPVDHLFQLADIEDPEEGHCVFVAETSYLYMYSDSKWVAIGGSGEETEKEIKPITGNSCRIKFD